ncbi:MAG: hypothetical protein RBS68_09430 [Anaerolineales bacterium]|jgi:hypothetical protein|nr:hypothetical protein [Anaerolineales bacterium]
MSFRFSPKTIPIAFAVLVVLAYGLLVTRTGFYWDDWPFAWGAHFGGPESFLRSFLRVRPFLGPIFYVTTSLLPETPLAWQVFALLVRFGLSISAWWALRSIWPARPRQTLAAALIFLVYPGYSQHWVALTHINQELIPLLFYILSFGATGWAFHSPARARPRTVIALLLLALGVFPTEYFVTLEPLRFLFLFVMLGPSPLVARARQALKLWLPYVLVWLLNAAWLFFYYRSGIYANYDVQIVEEAEASTLGLVSGFFAASGEAVVKAGFVAYAQILPLVMQAFPTPVALLTLALVAVTLPVLAFYLAHLPAFSDPIPESASRPDSAAKSADFILIGLVGIILGRIPSWAAGLPLTLQSSFDRFNVSLMLAASLLLVGLIELFIRSPRARLILVSLLVALGVGQQFYNANIFRRDWERQRAIYWQLAWRMPALAPGTVLFSDTLEIDYETDYALTAPLNWLYAPNLNSLQLPYLIFGVDMRPDRLPLQPNTPIEFPYRPAHFSGNTSQSIAFLSPRRGCLRILSPADEQSYQNLSARMRQAIFLSNPGLIRLSPASPPAQVFGPEPAPDWCFHYARAELARQQANWDEVARLDAQAVQLGLFPADPLEWLPFVEAGAALGEFDLSAARTRQTLAERPFLRKTFCAAWERAAHHQSLPAGLLAELGCQ